MNAKEQKKDLQRIIRNEFDSGINIGTAKELIQLAEAVEINGYKLDTDFIQEMKNLYAGRYHRWWLCIEKTHSL